MQSTCILWRGCMAVSLGEACGWYWGVVAVSAFSAWSQTHTQLVSVSTESASCHQFCLGLSLTRFQGTVRGSGVSGFKISEMPVFFIIYLFQTVCVLLASSNQQLRLGNFMQPSVNQLGWKSAPSSLSPWLSAAQWRIGVLFRSKAKTEWETDSRLVIYEERKAGLGKALSVLLELSSNLQTGKITVVGFTLRDTINVQLLRKEPF